LNFITDRQKKEDKIKEQKTQKKHFRERFQYGD